MDKTALVISVPVNFIMFFALKDLFDWEFINAIYAQLILFYMHAIVWFSEWVSKEKK